MTYQEAKTHVKTGHIESRYGDPCVCETVYTMPDGTRLQESESRLESTEWYYRLCELPYPGRRLCDLTFWGG